MSVWLSLLAEKDFCCQPKGETICFLAVFPLNKTPAKAFTPPAEPKMGTRPGRAVTREFIEGGYIHLFVQSPSRIAFFRI